jgi:hypothetical protein
MRREEEGKGKQREEEADLSQTVSQERHGQFLEILRS